MATHSSTITWKIPWVEEPGRLQSMGSQKSDTTELLHSLSVQFSSVQLLSHVQFFATPWTAALQASLSITNSRSPPKLMSIESVMPSNHLILCCPLLLLSSIFPNIRVFSNELALHIRWPKYWSFSFNISPSNEHPGLISFRMDWLDLLAVQGTLKSFPQHHSSKASILRHSAFFIVHLSHPYMTTGKTIAFRFVIAFLPRSKGLLILWLQSPSAVILEPKKMKPVTVSIVSPFICHEVVGLDAMTFVFWILSFKPGFSLSSFTFIKRFFSSPSLSAIKVVSSEYLRLLMFLPAISIPTCPSSSLPFCMMYSAYKLNKQGDNIPPWCTPFPIWSQSVFPRLVLTVASWPTCRFLRRHVRWSGIPISLRIFHSLLWSTQSKALFSVVSEAE